MVAGDVVLIIAETRDGELSVYENARTITNLCSHVVHLQYISATSHENLFVLLITALPPQPQKIRDPSVKAILVNVTVDNECLKSKVETNEWPHSGSLHEQNSNDTPSPFCLLFLVIAFSPHLHSIRINSPAVVIMTAFYPINHDISLV